MAAPHVIAVITLASLIVYALTGGADYGGGMWDLLASGPRRDRQRAVIAEAIGPIWEANHVWLILAIVLLFTAFPPAFSAIMTALHIPITAVLLGIVLRGSAFVFRKYGTHSGRWGTVFGIASSFTPFALGISLGAIMSGEIRVIDGTVATGFFAGWTRPFAISVGLFTQGLFAFLAAAYLTVDTAGAPDLQADFRKRALVAGLMLAPAAGLVFVIARTEAPLLFERLTAWWSPLLLAATSLCAVGALFFLWRGRFAPARLAAAGQVTLILGGWGLAQYPYLVVPDVTITEAATSEATLRMLIWTLALGAPFLLLSFGYLFYIFKRRDAP